MRWASIIAVGVYFRSVLSQRAAIGSWYEQDGPSQSTGSVGRSARSDAARTATGACDDDRLSRQRRDRHSRQRRLATDHAASRPERRLCRRRHRRHSRRQLRRSVPALRAELERSLSSELAGSAFAAQPGRSGAWRLSPPAACLK